MKKIPEMGFQPGIVSLTKVEMDGEVQPAHLGQISLMVPTSPSLGIHSVQSIALMPASCVETMDEELQ